jgi:hypothetical protein
MYIRVLPRLRPGDTVGALLSVGFSVDDEPTVNSQGELSVATSGSHNLSRRSNGRMQSGDVGVGLAPPGVPHGECETRGRQAVPLHLAQLDHQESADLKVGATRALSRRAGWRRPVFQGLRPFSPVAPKCRGPTKQVRATPAPKTGCYFLGERNILLPCSA